MQAARTGKLLPYGTVLARVRYDVLRDAKNIPILYANGRMRSKHDCSVSVLWKSALGGVRAIRPPLPKEFHALCIKDECAEGQAGRKD